MQTCVPAILPPLKELYPGDMAHDLRGTIFYVVIYIGGKDRSITSSYMYNIILAVLYYSSQIGGVVLLKYQCICF